MEILLNSKKYIADLVERRPIQPFAPAQAQSATSARRNIVMRDWFSVAPGIGGFGPRRTVDNPIKRTFTSTADTRWPDCITNARQRVATAVGIDQTIIKQAIPDRDSVLRFVAERTYSAASANSIRLGTRTLTWAGTPEGARIFSAAALGKYLIAVGNDVGGVETNQRIFYWDTGTGSGTLAAGHQNGTLGPYTTTITRRNTVTDFGGTLVTFGNTLMLLAYVWDGSATAVTTDTTAGKIVILRTTDPVGTTGQWYTHGYVASNGGATAAVIWRNAQGTSAPVFATAEGLYAVRLDYDTDLSDSNVAGLELLLPLPFGIHNGRGMSVHNGSLMVPLDSGQVLKVNYGGPGQFRVEEITPQYNAYLAGATVNAYRGTASVSRDRWWYMAYSSTAASEVSRILAFDGAEWHHMSSAANGATEVTAMNIDPIANQLQWEESASANYYTIAKDNIAPDSGATIQYETSSILEVPDYDGGLPEEPGILLSAYANFDSTAGSIVAKYGLEGAVSTTTTLGTHTVAAPTVNFGSGLGTSARRFRLQLTLTGASATDPIKLREYLLAYLKIPATRYAYQVVIDIDASAREFQRTRENIIADLETVMDNVPMVAFAYSQAAAVNVKAIPPWAWSETVGEASGWSMTNQADRSGTAQLLLVELL